MLALNQKRRSRSTRVSRSNVSVTPSRKRVADAGAHRILDPRVQQEHPLVDVDVGGAHLEHAIEGIARSAQAAQAREGEEDAPDAEQAAPRHTVPCWIAA